MCMCVLKLWGRGTTDHKRGHTVQSLQWCRKEEELGEGENGNKVKEKRTDTKKSCVRLCWCNCAQRKETHVPARLLELKGKFCFVPSEQESKSLVTDLQKWRQKCKWGRLADSGVACWTILACRQKKKEKEEGVGGVGTREKGGISAQQFLLQAPHTALKTMVSSYITISPLFTLLARLPKLTR